MAIKRIIWSANAKKELEQILNYYNERNGSKKYSLKILKEIDELLQTLSKSEFIGRLTSNKRTRVIPMKVYLVFYEINENIIEIISFWDNRLNDRK